MDIIEKLGIEPGYYFYVGRLNQPSEAVFIESDEMKQIKDTAPEMLEALIECCKCMEWEQGGIIPSVEDAIEKATGKTWEEIKELINE